MSDLIRRQDALDALGEKPLAWTEGEYELGLQNQWQSDVDALKALPFAEPERKKGTWIYDTERIMHDGWIYNQYHCSLCNCQVIGGLQNYCPYCGADMRGK